MNELAGQSLGGYQLQEEIGHGSMGVVYRGKQIALGREVAVKVLPQDLAKDTTFVARFIREAQIIAALNHPNIVQIYDAGQKNKLLYFVMEFVQGPTMSSLLQLDGIIPQHLATEYTAQIADALDFAYRESQVIHRDIKPENLMLDRWGKVKVMDFGLARISGQQRITVAKTLVGSIYYSSPEQVWGHTLDNRSDIYALGVVLYEMLCGYRPFTGRSMPELTRAIVSGVVNPPRVYNPEIAPELDQIVLAAIARDRNQRYADASLLARDLRALNLKASSSPASPTPSVPPSPQPAQSTQAQRPVDPGHTGQTGREPIIILPPKRPTAKRPRYMDQEISSEPTATPGLTARPATPPKTPAKQAKTDLFGPTLPLEQAREQLAARNNIPSDKDDITSQETRTGLWAMLQGLFKRPSR